MTLDKKMVENKFELEILWGPKKGSGPLQCPERRFGNFFFGRIDKEKERGKNKLGSAWVCGLLRLS